jgi:hydrogenase maturation protease
MDRVLVAGIGNVLMGDDAIGPFCIRRLQAKYQFPAGVNVVDLGAPGLDLTVHVAGAEFLVFVDCLRSGRPGEVRVFLKHEILLAHSSARLDTHAPALEAAIAIAGLSGHAPHDVRLVGLTGEAFDLGAPLSQTARMGIACLEEAVLSELARLGITPNPRSEPEDADIWWERPALV